MAPFRLVTLHPAAVHFAIGVLPLLVVAYAVAAVRRSERWTFLGDAALVASAVAAVASVATGVLAFVRLDWVGGSGGWRWAHVVLGVAAAVLLAAFAAVRLRRRARVPHSGGAAAVAAIAIAGLTAATGWIGGEVLVFRGGAGVAAAAEGTLAPEAGTHAAPRGLLEAMDRLRERWAEATTDTAYMVAVAPAPPRFARIARDADAAAGLAASLSRSGRAVPADVDQDIAAVVAAARELAAAARAQDLPAVAAALGKTSGACARCHDAMR